MRYGNTLIIVAFGLLASAVTGAHHSFTAVDHQAHIAYLAPSHPAGLKPSYSCHSVAQWDGTTLTVDSTSFNDKTEIFDGVGHMDKLHMTKRLRITASGQLEDQVTMEAPGAYTTAVSFTNLYERGQPYQEYVCAENNQDAEALTK